MRLGRSLVLAMLTLAGRPAIAGHGVSWRFDGFERYRLERVGL